MPKLSPNQEAALEGLRAATTTAEVVSKAVWKQHVADGVSINGPAMVKTGAVLAVQAGVSTNGKVVELYKVAPAQVATA